MNHNQFWETQTQCKFYVSTNDPWHLCPDRQLKN